jgi:hypothetical protein
MEGVPGACEPLTALYSRGDVNQDGEYDLSDAITILTYLFLGGNVIECIKAADSNDDGDMDLTDAVYSLAYLYLGTAEFPAPFPACGFDPTVDLLTCESHKACQN